MRTNKLYLLREVVGESILIPIGKASRRFNGMIHLTDTAVFIWKLVDTAADLQEIVSRLIDEYNISEEVASRDVYGFLTEFYKRGMVLDIPELKNVPKEEGVE